jgi:small subunit ribosomal protein S17
MTPTTNKKPTELQGVVVSDKMAKTVVVQVRRYVKHPKYGKYLVKTKRYKAHVETGAYPVGTAVTIRETRPISRDKHFIVVA